MSVTEGEQETEPRNVPPATPQSSSGAESVVDRRRWWLVYGLLLLLAVLAIVPHQLGDYAADNRFTLYWNPGQDLRQIFSLWSNGADLGGAQETYAPFTWFFAWVLHGLGVAPWLIERLFLTALLFVAGTGAVAVLRRFLPPESGLVGPAVAGIVYMVGPVASTALFPSWIFLSYAITPWLLLAFINGVTTEHRWRWAAIFALVMFSSAWINPPALFWALLPVLPTAWYLLAVERSTNWRTVGRWILTAGGLTLLVLGPGVFKVVYGSGILSTNLATTESAETVSQTSSWPETWRGLGFWLSYFSIGGVLFTHTARFFTNAWWVIVSFLVPVGALAVIWRSTWRPRLLFGALIVVGGTTMVGAFPIDNPSPFGRGLLALYDNVPLAFGLRTSYKAGGGLMLGAAALVGYGISWVYSSWRARARSPWRAGAGVLIVAFVVTIGWPFWSGDVYDSRLQMEDLPSYWRQASAWVNDQPGSTRVMVAPGVKGEVYRWGSPSDEIVDALFDRPNVMRRPISASPPQSANLIEALDALVSASEYQPGTFGPIARRLGIEYLVLRNDLEWEALGISRPADLAGLRADPSLELVASFGEPGENVVADDDDSSEADAEQRFPPVEVYRVGGVNDMARVAPVAPSVVVAGDGYAWGSLARDHYLDQPGAVRYSAALDATTMQDELEQGATLIVTDTNRRRRGGLFRERSETLPQTGADVEVQDLFGIPGSQTTAAYGEASAINQTSNNFANVPRGNRPAAAFDGDPNTAWLGSNGFFGPGQQVEILLERPQVLDQVRLRPADGPRQPTSVSIGLSDGFLLPALLTDGETVVDFPPREVDAIAVRIESVEGSPGAPVGFSEISIPGVDLREMIVVPNDVQRMGDEHPEVEDLLRQAPTVYSFERLRGQEPDEEIALRRRFDVAGPRAFELRGELRLNGPSDWATLRTVIGGESLAALRPAEDVDVRALRAVDGRSDSAWPETGSDDGALAWSFAPRPVASTELEIELAAPMVTQPSVFVAVGDQDPIRARVTRSECQAEAEGSSLRCTVSVPASGAEASTVTVGTATTPDGRITGQVPIAELRINGVANDLLVGSLAAACADLGLDIDQRAVPVRLTGDAADLIDGRPVAYRSCSPIEVTDGSHDLDSDSIHQVDSAVLTDVDSDPPGSDIDSADGFTLELVDRDDTTAHLRLRGEGQALLTSGIGYSPAWRARADGQSLEMPLVSDTQSSWAVTVSGETDVTLEFPAQRYYRWSVIVSLVSLLVCALLVQRNPESMRPRAVVTHRRAPWWADVALVLSAAVIAGFVGALLAIAGVVLARQDHPAGGNFAFAAFALVVLAAAATLPPLGPDLLPITSGWSSGRSLANNAGRVAAGALLVGLTLLGRAERPAPSEEPSVRAEAP